MVSYHQSSVFDRPYLSCNDHCDWWLFSEIFFYYYFYFLGILLSNLELVFLEFKHICKTPRTSLSLFYLFIFYLFFRHYFVYLHSPHFRTYPLRVNTQDEIVLYFACCFAITLCNNTLHLLYLVRFIKTNPEMDFSCYLSSMSIFLMNLKFS